MCKHLFYLFKKLLYTLNGPIYIDWKTRWLDTIKDDSKMTIVDMNEMVQNQGAQSVLVH